ncbi:short-chain dehydrogenase/reductase SDR [Enterobacter cancerogenus]|uniref:Short-chain dehydrogenase/reductase SDR n=1 Tax=Enterobacter cancerogenus TaxID=69218 RepID=A0A484Z191_9ENTR|nr:short-chain dehydrogenase/reductase SDR [Enterobacter cancerogenus]
MNAHIDGRVAVVTGGSSGIGFETLRLLLGEGGKSGFLWPRSGPARQRARGAAKRLPRRRDLRLPLRCAQR